MTPEIESVGVPELTSRDIIKLMSVTYLPLCEALSAAGVICEQDLAARILDLSAPQLPAAWAKVAIALAAVLERPDCVENAEPKSSRAAFTVITGGRAK